MKRNYIPTSAVRFDATLMQLKSEKKFHLIFYFLKRTRDVESQYYSFELEILTSAIGFGATLMQLKSDKKFHSIFYFLKGTVDVGSQYYSFELEMLTIVYALYRLRSYLQGIKFTIVKGCDLLKVALNKKEINPRIS